MASKPKSRWADDEADAVLEAQRKKDREDKKRLKAERARKLAAERQALEAQAAADNQSRPAQDGAGADEDAATGHRAKRQRVSPDRETRGQSSATTPGTAPYSTSTSDSTSKLLRFQGGAFGRCRSVENYDKLNDIEEGAYGWVARAQEIATGKVVALKRLKIDPKDRSGLPVTGLREIQILKDCHHRNVVRLQEVVVGDDTSTIEK